MQNSKPCPRIITIDGPAGAGKSTLAKKLAVALDLAYLDTGAMFRCLALALRGNADIPATELAKIFAELRFGLCAGRGSSGLLCRGLPPGEEIRSEEVALMASRIAGNFAVRELMKSAQQELGTQSSLVAEGRDMGTEVFPQATNKFFLEASPEVRAMRRLKEMEARGQKQDLAELVASIRKRDTQDRERALAPLRPADDAIIIDTSRLDIDGVFKALMIHVRQSPQSPRATG